MSPFLNRWPPVLVVIAVFLVGLIGLASVVAFRNYGAARGLIEASSPSPLLNNPAGANLANLQSIVFVSRGSQVAAWYVPSKNRAAVVVTHGVQSDRASMLTELRLLAAADFGILAFDWPGLGASGGPVRWDTEAKDALSAAIDWMAARPDVDPCRIGGLGFSIGGFVMTQVAAKDKRLRAVVIESAATDFDSYLDVHYSKWGLLSHWPARWALRDSGLLTAGNSSLSHIGEISPRPVFIIGETGDPQVPASMIRQLDEAAGPPKQLWLINGMQHGGYDAAAGIEYARRLQAFFKDNLFEAGAVECVQPAPALVISPP